MDETDTTPSGVEAESERAAREWAEQRRAAARAQFSTPSWIGPSRTPEAPAEPTSLIPPQAEPQHDFVVPPQRLGPPIPESAHWVEKAKPRIVAGVILVAAIGGLITSGALAIATQSSAAIVALVSCAFVAVIFRGALMSASVVTTDLKGSTLRIRRGGVQHVFNLADPGCVAHLIGTPGQSGWRLHLESLDGHVVELGHAQVNPEEMHRVVEHYRAIASRDQRERERRFNR